MYTIGTHITEDKVLRQDNELRYRPVVGNQSAAQVADILDITDDVLEGAPTACTYIRVQSVACRVSTKRGLSAESPNTSRILFMDVFRL